MALGCGLLVFVLSCCLFSPFCSLAFPLFLCHSAAVTMWVREWDYLTGWTWFFVPGYGSRSWSEGEYKADWGPVFGRAELLPRSFRGGFYWDPSECNECGRPLPHYWVNYNYRCCMGCWHVISPQLWYYLVGQLRRDPAAIVWSFLMEPTQH